VATLIQIESHSGEWWTIIGEGKGDRGVWLGQSVSGLWAVPLETIYNSTAYQDGADYGGKRIGSREISFDVEILKTKDEPWERNWSDWMKAFRPDKDSKIWYETENSRRYLKVRLSTESQMSPKFDPDNRQHVTLTMNLIAGDPWWYEEEAKSTFVTTTDTTAGGVEVGEIPIWNDTPVQMYPQWVFQGVAGIEWTLPDFSHGQEAEHDRDEGVDATRVINMPPTIEGEHVYIDVDPLAREGQANSSLDTEYYMRMNGVRFIYPAPEYFTHPDGRMATEQDPIMLPIAVTGAPIGAGVQLRMRRAWPTPMGMQ